MDDDVNAFANSKFTEIEFAVCRENVDFRLPLTYNESSFLGLKDPGELNTNTFSMRLKLLEEERSTAKKRARVERRLYPIKIDTSENETKSYNELVAEQRMKLMLDFTEAEIENFKNNPTNINNELRKDLWLYEKVEGVDGHQKWNAKNNYLGMEIVFDTNCVVKIELIPQEIVAKIQEPPSKACISDPYYKILSENSLQKLSFTTDDNSEPKKRPLPQLTTFDEPLVKEKNLFKDAIESAKKKYQVKEELKQKKKIHIQPDDDKKKSRPIVNKNEKESNQFCHDVLKPKSNKPKPKHKIEFASYNHFNYDDLKKKKEKRVCLSSESDEVVTHGNKEEEEVSNKRKLASIININEVSSITRKEKQVNGFSHDEVVSHGHKEEVSKKRKLASIININGVSSITRKEKQVNGFSHHDFPKPKPKSTIEKRSQSKEKEELNRKIEIKSTIEKRSQSREKEKEELNRKMEINEKEEESTITNRKEKQVNRFSHDEVVSHGHKEEVSKKRKLASIININGGSSIIRKEKQVNGFSHHDFPKPKPKSTIEKRSQEKEKEELNSKMEINEKEEESTITTRKEKEVNGFSHDDVVSKSDQQFPVNNKFNYDALDYEDEGEDAELDIHPDEDDFNFVDNYLPPVSNGVRFRKFQ